MRILVAMLAALLGGLLLLPGTSVIATLFVLPLRCALGVLGARFDPIPPAMALAVGLATGGVVIAVGELPDVAFGTLRASGVASGVVAAVCAGVPARYGFEGLNAYAIVRPAVAAAAIVAGLVAALT